MIGTITKVFEKNEEKNWPGKVEFSDGTKLTTFSDALIATALNGIGQIAEYTTAKNGKYTNLASLTLKGAAPAAQSSVPDRGARVAKDDVEILALVSATRDLTAAIRELTSQFGRGPLDLSKLEIRTGKRESAPEPEEPAVDPIEAAQARLAKHIGSPDAAAAQFDALRAKHAKSPEKLKAAVEELLKAHGVA